jgi:two-component system sensor histidine kinase QseC
MSWLEGTRASLRGRLGLGLVAGSVVVLSLSFILLHLLIRDALYDSVDDDLFQRMNGVAEYAIAHPGSEEIAEFMPQFRASAHRDFFQIWDARGHTLVRSDSSAGRDLPKLSAVVNGATYHDLVLPDGHHGRAISRSFALEPGDPRQILTVVMAREIEIIDALERRIHFALLFTAIGTIIAMLLIARYSVITGLRPLDELVRQLERVDPENPQSRVQLRPVPTELRPVAEGFAALLDRLLEALAREKRYARNVAHELRTPLTEIRLLADVGGSAQDLQAMRASIRDIGATADEMERTVDSLLALTRYEAGIETPQPEPIDLCAEVRRQALAMKVSADQHELTIEFDLPDEVWVHADSTLWRRLLANLLGNAIAHSPRQSVVRISLSPDGELRLVNPAPHLAATDVPRLGERFFRIGAGNGGSHAGLGLSLAAALAKVLGVRLELKLRDDGCLVVSIAGFHRLEPSAQADRIATEGVDCSRALTRQRRA